MSVKQKSNHSKEMIENSSARRRHEPLFSDVSNPLIASFALLWDISIQLTASLTDQNLSSPESKWETSQWHPPSSHCPISRRLAIRGCDRPCLADDNGARSTHSFGNIHNGHRLMSITKKNKMRPLHLEPRGGKERSRNNSKLSGFSPSPLAYCTGCRTAAKHSSRGKRPQPTKSLCQSMSESTQDRKSRAESSMSSKGLRMPASFVL